MPPRRAAAVSAASNLAASAPNNNRSVSGPAVGSSSKADGTKEQNGTASRAKVQKQPAAGAASTSSGPPPPAQPLSPIVSRLRKMWKFAAVCQFLFTFDEAFGMSGFETEALENDLDGTETRVIPDLMRRLLYTLTLNRTIDEGNWEDHLRAQYVRREPDNPLLGTVEEPLPWHGLPLTKKVDSLHTTCEWQLWDAERFRKLVKNEEDAHVWRIDPIGWDSQDNTYWLFDDNRLWVQHPPPPPPAAKAAPKKSSKKAKAEARREAQKRKREATTPSTPARASLRAKQTPPSRVSPRSRQATGEAMQKQARRSRGGRTEEWEPIPPELLYAEDGNESKALEDDSDLSDPPEEDETMEIAETKDDFKSEADVHSDGHGSSRMDVDDGEDQFRSATDEKSENALGINGAGEDQEGAGDGDKNGAPAAIKEEKQEPDWVEFETVAVTRAEWEWISTRFARSKHPDEKALHQLLKEDILPKVMADLAESEKQRAHELAMANRKRSSRIALKESEREERERDRVARLKMEEKMSTIREEEEAAARRERDEMDAARVREERLREREERALAREREAIERATREIEERERRERMRELRKLKREQIIANGGHPPEEDDESLDVEGSDRPGQEDDSWELDCEVCGKRGINLDDTEEIVCCENCGIWQHTECWNAFDRSVGRAPRDWENEDFFCSRCRPPAPGNPRPQSRQYQQQQIHQSMATASMSADDTHVRDPPSQGATSQPNPQGNHYPSATAYSSSQAQGTPTSFPPYTSTYGTYSSQSHQHKQRDASVAPNPLTASHVAPLQGSAPNSSSVSQGKNESASIGSQAQHHGNGRQPTADQLAPQQAIHVRPQQDTSAPMRSESSIPIHTPQQNRQVQMTQAPARPMGAHPHAHNGAHPSGQPATLQAVASKPVIPSPAAGPPPAAQYGSMGAPSSTSTRQSPSAPSTSPAPPVVSPSMSPKQAALPMRSPSSSSSAATSSVPRSIASQPSGSFPMRHTPARSPLSGPHHPSPTAMPAVSLGPPLRSGSPSPISRHAGQPGRPAQLNHELLHSRQSSHSDASLPTQSAPAPANRPGPASGSLARPCPSEAIRISAPPEQLPAQPVSNTVSAGLQSTADEAPKHVSRSEGSASLPSQAALSAADPSSRQAQPQSQQHTFQHTYHAPPHP